jgi:hypothetical protein
MILTDANKAQAKALGLTFTEMHVALTTHVAPETYAKHKAEMQAERDAWDAKMDEFAGVAAERLEHARGLPHRGVGLPPIDE